MKQIPKHAELIKLWADGALIQWFDAQRNVWKDCHNNLPIWTPRFNYRVKPEPKPDRIEIRKLTYNPDFGCIVLNGGDNHNIQFVFDGETGKLKDAQVLAQE